MRIEPLNSKIACEIQKVENAKKTDRDKLKNPAARPDRSDFSSKAQRLSQTRANADIVSAQITVEPEIREEKVAEVRKKIESGFYNSSEFVDKLAEKLLAVFGMIK